MSAITKDSVGGSQNIIAGLDLVAHSEGTFGIGDDGYNVIVGSTSKAPVLFSDYKQHPNKLQTMFIHEKKVTSTAAGRYQILFRYATAYMKQLKLVDFGKISQDRIALQLFRETGAYEAFREGRFYTAIKAASSRWASFPGSGYGQHENDLEQMADWYMQSGGVITDGL